jgi:hypothetical protein
LLSILTRIKSKNIKGNCLSICCIVIRYSMTAYWTSNGRFFGSSETKPYRSLLYKKCIDIEKTKKINSPQSDSRLANFDWCIWQILSRHCWDDCYCYCPLCPQSVGILSLRPPRPGQTGGSDPYYPHTWPNTRQGPTTTLTVRLRRFWGLFWALPF